MHPWWRVHFQPSELLQDKLYELFEFMFGIPIDHAVLVSVEKFRYEDQTDLFVNVKVGPVSHMFNIKYFTIDEWDPIDSMVQELVIEM